MTTHVQDRGLDSLVLDLLEWVAAEPRTYRQTMDTWRTSCPRLAVWEESIDRGLVARLPRPGGGAGIVLTGAGETFLQHRRRSAMP